ncbi:hypothetical protein HN011_004548, partial [Eciton burchellii]
ACAHDRCTDDDSSRNTDGHRRGRASLFRDEDEEQQPASSGEDGGRERFDPHDAPKIMRPPARLSSTGHRGMPRENPRHRDDPEAKKARHRSGIPRRSFGFAPMLPSHLRILGIAANRGIGCRPIIPAASSSALRPRFLIKSPR